MTNRRSLYIDFVKGVLIFLVIFGHVLQYIKYGDQINFWYSYLFKFIYMFHMPLFIGISGYFAYFSLEKNTPGNYLKSRVRVLLIPLIVWSILLAVIGILIYNKFDIGFMSRYSIGQLRAFWFIWAIIVYSIIVSLLKILRLNNIFIITLLAIIFSFVSCLSTGIFAVIKGLFPFFIVGFALAQSSIDINKIYSYIKKYLVLLLFPAVICFILWDMKDYIYITPSEYHYWDITIFRFLASLIFSVFFMVISYIIYQYIEKKKITYFLIKLGKETLAIYIVQTFFFSIYSEFFLQPTVLPGISILYIIPAAILTMLIYYFIRLLSKNEYLSLYLFGKRKNL